MRVYIAASRLQVDRARDVAAAIRAAGHTVTSRWLDAMTEETHDPTDADTAAQIIAENDADIREADAVVVLTYHAARGEHLAEVGFARAIGKRIVWSRRWDGAILSLVACATIVESDAGIVGALA